ncbi:MAG TPA: M50 family metallopeptidase [Desulfuromonadaceae bacterium]|nr:M50 family metallopeptidase [Desulfuromonadaceae bacterium]
MPTRQGSFKLFRLFGITVYLHWAWFIAIIYLVNQSKGYDSPVWSVLECLSLFLIVLMHEFGHALACRSVGGRADQIVLWPLGGVAYVAPPQRPAPVLWSIAAGPLVNVALVPVFAILVSISSHLRWYETNPDLYELFHRLSLINAVLLVFNLLPVFPLDGGQILRSLLWFPFGRANSLLAASIIGFIGVGGLILLALWLQSPWMGVMCVFIVLNCWGGLKQGQALAKIAKAPRRDGFRCPECKALPPMGNFWRCSNCRQPFDTFETHGICPHCSVQYTATSCPECGSLQPLAAWESLMPPPLP